MVLAMVKCSIGCLGKVVMGKKKHWMFQLNDKMSWFGLWVSIFHHLFCLPLVLANHCWWWHFKLFGEREREGCRSGVDMWFWKSEWNTPTHTNWHTSTHTHTYTHTGTKFESNQMIIDKMCTNLEHQYQQLDIKQWKTCNDYLKTKLCENGWIW